MVLLRFFLGLHFVVAYRAGPLRRLPLRRETVVRATGSGAAFDATVLVVGGSGRVGASTVRWLDKLARRDGQRWRLLAGGRSLSNFESAQRRLSGEGVEVEFKMVDLDADAAALQTAVADVDLVVHTAGPFQQRTDPSLLRASLEAGVPYVDVCDEIELSRNAKALAPLAISKGVPAVVSGGIWPGVSALMAAEAVARLGGTAERLEFSFFTAGTGGAGPTIVSATFLLLCTEVLCFVDGVETPLEPWTQRRVVDFGPGIGNRECFLLDNPDVPTSAEALGVPNAASRFGTAPTAWNSLFAAIKAVLPPSLLANRAAMQNLAIFSMPIIRAVDALVGATNAMRVDATAADGRTVTLRVAHRDLEDCVGQATAAFAREVLASTRADSATIAPGVWFPAELDEKARTSILDAARENAFVWDL